MKKQNWVVDKNPFQHVTRLFVLMTLISLLLLSPSLAADSTYGEAGNQESDTMNYEEMQNANCFLRHTASRTGIVRDVRIEDGVLIVSLEIGEGLIVDISFQEWNYQDENELRSQLQHNIADPNNPYTTTLTGECNNQNLNRKLISVSRG
jgi:hypothetical protein